jgi:hypothetical protein
MKKAIPNIRSSNGAKKLKREVIFLNFKFLFEIKHMEKNTK